ncbi:MAG: hypothetical protein ACRDAM_09000 [Casimicrobium sp.]
MTGFASTNMQHEALFNQLQGRANALRAGTCDARAFVRAVADAAPMIASLPPPYERAMTAIVTRLESAAMFGGESCSFSHTELYGALDTWLAKAAQKLESSVD